jgi:hypothetical protein
VLVAGGAVACGGASNKSGGVSPPTPDASTPPADASTPVADASAPAADASAPIGDASTPLGGGGQAVPYLQVDLSITGGQVVGTSTGLSQGQVAFQAVTPLTLPPPPAALGGEYALVALTNNQPQAFAFVHFPSTFLMEGPDANGDWSSQSVSLTGSATTVFVPYAAYDSLEVIDASGNVVASQGGVPALPSPEYEYYPSLTGFSPIPGLTVLTPASAQLFISEFPLMQLTEDTYSYDITTDPAGQALVTAALANVAPGPLASLHYILIADKKKPDAGLDIGGSAIKVNRAYFTADYLPAILVHESAHVYADLLDDADPTSKRHWSSNIEALAQKVLADPLITGFTAYWTQMHNDGLKNGLALPYTGQIASATDLKGGFVAPYGAENAHEDIATYTEFLQLPDDPHLLEQQPPGSDVMSPPPGPPWFCSELSNARGTFPVADTIPYVKLQLLVNAGFITPAKLAQCIGNNVPVIGATGAFVENVDGSNAVAVPKVPHQGGLAAGVDATGNAWLAAEGASNAAASASLVPDAKNNPLGWSRLARRGHNIQVTGPQFSFFGNVNDALVFVQEASSSQLSFAVFNMELPDVTVSPPATRVFPYATFSVPITHAPGCPLITNGWSCSLTDPNGVMLYCVDNFIVPGDPHYDPNASPLDFGMDMCNPGIASNYLDPGSNYYGYHTDLEQTLCPKPAAPCGGCSLPADACMPDNDLRGVDNVTWYYTECTGRQQGCLLIPASNAYSQAPDESYTWLSP